MQITAVSLACRIALAGVFVVAMSSAPRAHDEPNGRPHHIDVPASPTAVMRAFSEGKLDDDLSVQNLEALTVAECIDGFADGYPCDNVDLMSFMPLSEIGSTQSNDEGNDAWGWTDPETGNEYAIIGRVFGTSFVDISDPANPIYLGELRTHGQFGSPWRDGLALLARLSGLQRSRLRRLRHAGLRPDPTITPSSSARRLRPSRHAGLRRLNPSNAGLARTPSMAARRLLQLEDPTDLGHN